jgi:hypothetical protein
MCGSTFVMPSKSTALGFDWPASTTEAPPAIQEYEKRLLAKDHEIKAAQASAQELQKRLDVATAKLADASRMAPAPVPAPQGNICVFRTALSETSVPSCIDKRTQNKAVSMLP